MSRFPAIGLTLLPPWWYFILWGGKRVENRSPRMTTRVRAHVGHRVAITSSKAFNDLDVLQYLEEQVDLCEWANNRSSPSLRELARLGGRLVGTACIGGVLSPDISSVDVKWKVQGELGIVLRDVRPVEPVPCTGGLGLWELIVCECNRPMAKGSRCPNQCGHPQQELAL